MATTAFFAEGSRWNACLLLAASKGNNELYYAHAIIATVGARPRERGGSFVRGGREGRRSSLENIGFVVVIQIGRA